MDIICIGEILVDFIPGELPHTYICKAGGAPANVAVAAARNGLDAGVCGRVGADTFGDFLESTLRANGVTFLTPQRVGDAVTTMAFVTLDEMATGALFSPASPAPICSCPQMTSAAAA